MTSTENDRFALTAEQYLSKLKVLVSVYVPTSTEFFYINDWDDLDL